MRAGPGFASSSSDTSRPADVGDVPIVCTLTRVELEDRGSAWRKVLGSGLVERTEIPGGIRLATQPGARAALAELIDLERECCAWITYAAPDDSTFDLTAEGDGAEVLAQMFKADAPGGVIF